MTAGSPFGFGFGFAPVQMPGPVDIDPRRNPRRMQLAEDEQRAIVARALAGAQTFHPGNGPMRQAGFGDQDQDAGQGGEGASAQQSTGQDPGAPPQAWQDTSLLSSLFDRAPMGAPQSFSGTSGAVVQDQSDVGGGPQQGPAPPVDMSKLSLLGAGANGPQAAGPAAQPAAPYAGTEADVQQLERQQASPEDLAALYGSPGRGAPAQATAGMPSLMGAPTPQMPAPGDPRATGAIPQQPTAEDAEEAAATAPASRAAPASPAPTPPARPSDLSSLRAGMSPVDSFDPLTGQPVSGSPRPLGGGGEFDPLTGQPVSGSPRPVASSGSGTEGAARQAPEPAPGSPAWEKEHPILAGWKRLGDSGVGDQLLAFGAGMLQGHSFAEGAGKGFQNMLAVGQSRSAGDAQRLEYALKIQKAQQEQGALTANAQLIQKAFPDFTPQQALGGASNSTLVSAAIAKMQNRNAGRDIKSDAQGVSRYTDTGEKVFADDDGTDDPKEVEISGKKYWLKPGEKPSEDNLIGQAKDPQEMTAELRNYQALKNAGDPRTFPEYMRDKEQNKGPTVKTITLPDGSKVDREWDPNTRTWVAPNLGANAPAARDNSDVPPGVDPTTYRKESAKAAVAEQKADNQRAQQANMAMPILERAEKAYKALADAKAIGPYQASRLNRAIGGAMGADVEVQRQEYEAAAKELELTKAQIQMKGQGSVTENERAILRMTLPRLDAASPETGLNTLRGMREQFMKAASAGRGHAPAQQGSGQQQGGGSSQSGQQQAPQANAAASRYQQLRRGGMSQGDAYARMQQEGY